MLKFDAQKCLVEVRAADTADLLDRVTAYRPAMEPDAVNLIEQELARRGVGPSAVAEHMAVCQRDCLFDRTGTAFSCSFCRRPAVFAEFGWYRLFRLVQLFPQPMRYCTQHRPA